MKCAMIGLGRISDIHKNCLISLANELELVAICDLDEQKISHFKTDYEQQTQKQVYATQDYTHILKYMPDFVIIAVDTGSHFEIAKFFLQNNISCMVEKPLALSGKQCKILQKLADRNGLNCGVFFQNRYNLAVEYLKRAIMEERFGKISNISGRMIWGRDKSYYDQSSWRGKWISDGGAFSNQAIHCIDVCQYLANSDIKSINCTLKNRFHPYIEVEDYGNMTISFYNGIVANIEATVNCTCDMEETILIVGEKGYAEIGGIAMNKILKWQFSDKKDYDGEVKKEFTDPANVYGHGHINVYRNYIKSVKAGKKFEINFFEASKAVNILLTAYKSGKLNKKIKYKTNINIKTMKNINLNK